MKKDLARPPYFLGKNLPRPAKFLKKDLARLTEFLEKKSCPSRQIRKREIDWKWFQNDVSFPGQRRVQPASL